VEPKETSQVGEGVEGGHQHLSLHLR